MNQKRCGLCGVRKPLSEFWKRARSADGLQSRCISCGSTPEVRAKKLERIRLVEPEVLRGRARKNRLANPEVYRSLDLARYRRDRPKRLKLAAFHSRRRRLAKLNAFPQYYERTEIFDQYSGRCFYCNLAEAAQVDHIFPLRPIRGLQRGVDRRFNLVPACAICNLRKGNRSPYEFLGRWADLQDPRWEVVGRAEDWCWIGLSAMAMALAGPSG